MRSLPTVTDAIVWRLHGHGRDFLAAGVETALSRAKLEESLAARLSAWKMPKCYFIATELPRTIRGKLDMTAMQKQIEETFKNGRTEG